MWIGCGRCSCAASILSTPSGSSSKSWAGRSPASAHPLRPTAGPGWSSARTPNSDWPATPSRTCSVPGRKQPPNQAAVPGPHPPGVSQHPTGNRHAGPRTETLTARARPSTRITQRPTSPPTQPRQNHQNRHSGQGRKEASSLKLKLRRRWPAPTTRIDKDRKEGDTGKVRRPHCHDRDAPVLVPSGVLHRRELLAPRHGGRCSCQLMDIRGSESLLVADRTMRPSIKTK
jgi:hypothetical protein